MLVRTGNCTLSYDLVGPESAPVVCMTHCLSADSGVWAEQVPALLARDWRVLRLNMRGHGGSDLGPADPSMADYAEDVAQALKLLGIERVHFVGLSIGGMIGQTFALHHGEKLISLLLCGTAPRAVPGGPEMWEARFNAVRAANSVEPVSDAAMERWFTPAFKAQRPQRWAEIRETISRTSVGGYVAAAKAVMKFDVADRLPNVGTPTLVMCGDEDPGTPPDGNRLIASRIPGARYQEIKSARHLSNVERSESFNQILLDWLAAHR